MAEYAAVSSHFEAHYRAARCRTLLSTPVEQRAFCRRGGRVAFDLAAMLLPIDSVDDRFNLCDRRMYLSAAGFPSLRFTAAELTAQHFFWCRMEQFHTSISFKLGAVSHPRHGGNLMRKMSESTADHWHHSSSGFKFTQMHNLNATSSLS